ncbi:hypothetical protein [Psychromonas sp. SP041]|uniref:hypothetical protein n=1 Tax=Psychromonas sp. SP041 TaxID=1365007 RepID=UPI0003FB1290|nr:hypothetical protein [Psychromonas sp. SP041]
MDTHIATLNKLISVGGVDKIDSSSDYDLSIIEDLLNSQYIDATAHRPLSGSFTYFHVKANLNGREWLSNSVNQSSPAEDIIELKPNFMGLGINLNALLRMFKRK